jgi:hypothetical protein
VAHIELIVTDIKRGEHTVTVTGINQDGKEESTHLKPEWFEANTFKLGAIVDYARPTHQDWALNSSSDFDGEALEAHVARILEGIYGSLR